MAGTLRSNTNAMFPKLLFALTTICAICSTLNASIHQFDLKMVGSLPMIKGIVQNDTGYFILDTGAPGLALHHAIDTNTATVSYGIDGQVLSNQTVINEFELGTLNWQNIEAQILDLNHLSKAKGVKVLGLLGVELFKDYVLTIDYNNRKLYCQETDFKGNVIDSLPVKYQLVQEGQMLLLNNRVYAFFMIGNELLTTLIDTGAELCVISNKHFRKWRSHFDVLRKIQVIDVSGKSSTYVKAGYADGLEFGSLVLGKFLAIKSPIGSIHNLGEQPLNLIAGNSLMANYVVQFNFKKRVFALLHYTDLPTKV
ncbi:MAG: retropepsin-like domain-containing protein [Bacteroidetes bacterium]|nr:retropepsin-like domain-containing protein [Bacteroidota bacterium]